VRNRLYAVASRRRAFSIGPVRVLIVEDEPGIQDFIVRGLTDEGYVVLCAFDGIEGERLALEEAVDLVVLDLMLPGKSGMEVLAAIHRQRPLLPVILLTARGGVEDRVSGLDAGATDYIVKPFAFAELAARVRTHLRNVDDTRESVLHAGGIELDLVSRRATRAGIAVQLTAKECELLALFMRSPGELLTRERLLHDVWGYDFTPHSNIAEVYVGYLRRKLRREGLPDPIHTVRFNGYRLKARA
jgi:DNA-binding response OmpR family regulator